MFRDSLQRQSNGLVVMVETRFSSYHCCAVSALLAAGPRLRMERS